MELVTNLTRLAAAFPRDNATEATLAVYVEELAHLDQNTLQDVLGGIIRSASRFPTVAEIREAYSAARRREAESNKTVTALPLGRAPMPREIKNKLREMQGRFEERSQEIKNA